jgi:DNA-binding NarL/FixJ family response regulator
VVAAAEAALAARGDEAWLKRVFAQSRVPMMLVDNDRRYVDINLALRLVFHTTLEQIRGLRADDLAPERQAYREDTWRQTMERGSLMGTDGVLGLPTGERIEVVYCAVANVLPGLHLGVVAPAAWSEEEFGELPTEVPTAPAAHLTPRELEVLQLAARGYTGPQVARELVLSPTTVHTHFEHIYSKLAVRDRASAVAKAMRLGLID